MEQAMWQNLSHYQNDNMILQLRNSLQGDENIMAPCYGFCKSFFPQVVSNALCVWYEWKVLEFFLFHVIFLPFH